MWKITVDKERCTGCSECVDGCPGEVYELQNGKAVPVHVEECHGCRSCEDICEVEAISIEDE